MTNKELEKTIAATEKTIKHAGIFKLDIEESELLQKMLQYLLEERGLRIAPNKVFIVWDYDTGRYWEKYYHTQKLAEAAIKATGRDRVSFMIEETGMEVKG